MVFKNCMESIYKNDDKNVEKLISLILIVFLVDNKNPVEYIHSAKFLLESIQLVSKSNVKDPNILNIKKTLAAIAEVNSAEYNKTERQNTKVAITKAIFQYFVLMIQISK
jgi:predicted tellurium resistance membrane protein TerC